MKNILEKRFTHKSVLLCVTALLGASIMMPNIAFADNGIHDNSVSTSKSTKTSIDQFTLVSYLSEQSILPTKSQMSKALIAGIEAESGKQKVPFMLSEAITTNVTDNTHAIVSTEEKEIVSALSAIQDTNSNNENESSPVLEAIVPVNERDNKTVVEKNSINVSELDKTMNIAAAEKLEKEKIVQERLEKERLEAEAAAAAAAAAEQALIDEQVSLNNAIINAAISQLGTPYVWGGTTPNGGLDCSGLTQYCYSTIGISTGRTSDNQYAYAYEIVPISQAEPGDILWNSYHVGIYVGGSDYIHAPVPGDVVKWASGIDYFSYALRFTPTVGSVS